MSVDVYTRQHLNAAPQHMSGYCSGGLMGERSGLFPA